MSNALNAQKRIHDGKRSPFALSAIASLALLAIATLALVVIGSDTAFAGGFNPSGEASLSDSTPGANANITTSFDLPAPDYQFGGLITFTPAEFSPATDADIPDGAGVTFLASLATLGVINGPCIPGGLKPEFQMMDATTNTSGPTVGFGDDPSDPGDTGEIFEDDDGDTLPNGVEMYPDFLLRIFPGLQPRARLYGQTDVVGNDVSLNFVLFEPGTSFPRTGEQPFETDAALGYPSVTVLQNLGDPEAEPNPSTITDFCTPLDTDTTVCGVTQDKNQMSRTDPCPSSSGTPVRTNPSSDMTVNAVTVAISQPDADGDGLENGLDTCPYDTNVENPRDGGLVGDPDVDGIDSACDPAPNAFCGPGLTGTSPDCDGDGFLNRGDNCPLVWNGDDLNTPNVVEGQENADNDGIGDVCDQNPNSIDGDRLVAVEVMPMKIGAGGTPCFTANDIEVTLNHIRVTNNRCAADGAGATPTPTPAPGAGATPTPTPSPGETQQEKEATKTSLLKELGETLQKGERGLALDVTADTVELGGSTNLVAVCVEKQNGLQPIVGEDLTFKIDDQPGSDADLNGEAEVTKATDADGSATVTLNVGSTAGDIVVSATGETCGTDTVTVTAGAVAGTFISPDTDTSGPDGGVDTGVGSLAPMASSIPSWAAIMSALGSAGLLGSLGAIASRILRRRHY